MTRRPRTWMAMMLALAVAGCTTKEGLPPAGPPLSLTELKNATYRGLEGLDPVTLMDGRWDGEPPSEGGASRPVVQFVRDFHMMGDLDGDGSDEAVVLLGETSGGSGEFLHLAVVARREATAENVATALIGDRVQVRSARLDSNRVVLDVVQSGTQDPACCPGELATRTWTFDGATLAPDEDDVATGRLSVGVVAGTEWVLRWWDWDDPAPENVTVTLGYQEGRLAGTSGCNRYSAMAKDGDMPGDLVLGPAVTTRMACPGPAMEVEARFLKHLGGAKKIGFLATMLALSYEVDGKYGVMLFEGREPAAAGN